MSKVSSMFINVNPFIKSYKIIIDYLVYEEQIAVKIIMKISIFEKVIFQT
jgi:hypothetical protein